MKKRTLRPYAYIPTKLLCDGFANYSRLRVFGVIVSHMNPRRLAWPALDTIGDHLDMTRPNVCKAIRWLVKAGYLEKKTVGGGRKRSTIYFIPNFNQNSVSRDTETVDLEDTIVEKILSENSVSGDNQTVSTGTHKDNRNIPTPLTPLARGETDGPDGPVTEELRARYARVMDGPEGPPLVGRDDARAPSLSASGETETENFFNFSKSEQYAYRKIREYIGIQNGADNYLMAAYDTNHSGHNTALRKCQAIAQELGLRWEPFKKSEMERTAT